MSEYSFDPRQADYRSQQYQEPQIAVMDRAPFYVPERLVTVAEGAMERIAAEAADPRRSRVIVEGPPLYLWPKAEHPTQQWDHPAFAQGWEYTDQVASRLLADGATAHKLEHWALVDDYNNRPADVSALDGTRISDAMQAMLGHLPISRQVDTGWWESSFATEGGDNACANLDAGFQRQKLISSLSMSEEGQMPLLVVVHPETFMGQQQAMLERLNGTMKTEPFNALSKKARRELISDVYRHAWIDDYGQVTRLTQPRWNGNKFEHQEVQL